MSRSIEGIYRNGNVELVEPARGVAEETRLLVTFLESGDIDLRSRNINERQAAELRARLDTFDDWSDPEMAAYDNYDAAHAHVL